MQNLVIRRIGPEDSISELTSLLHRSYARLLDIGLRFTATHQSEEVTRERCEGGECYVALQDGKLIGTITYRSPDRSDGCPWYDRPDVGYFTQFAVDPDLQGGGIGYKLLALVEERAKEDGAVEFALDTSEGATHLIDYYRRAGYRFVEFVRWESVNYRSVIMSKKLR